MIDYKKYKVEISIKPNYASFNKDLRYYQIFSLEKEMLKFSFIIIAENGNKKKKISEYGLINVLKYKNNFYKLNLSESEIKNLVRFCIRMGVIDYYDHLPESYILKRSPLIKESIERLLKL